MSLLVWIIFGLVVGIIANALDPRPAYGGILGAIILGILGAVIGGFLGDILLGVGVSGLNLPSFFVAIAGALILLAIGRMMRREI